MHSLAGVTGPSPLDVAPPVMTPGPAVIRGIRGIVARQTDGCRDCFEDGATEIGCEDRGDLNCVCASTGTYIKEVELCMETCNNGALVSMFSNQASSKPWRGDQPVRQAGQGRGADECVLQGRTGLKECVRRLPRGQVVVTASNTAPRR